MNSPFYDFWGTFLTDVAQGQKQPEEISAWIKQGFHGAEDLAALFRRAYGLKAPDRGGTREPPGWQEAVADFQSAFTQFAAQCGWVTRAEHQKVLDKCSALEKQVQSQQDHIRQLQDLLAQKGLGHTELLKYYFQNALNDQNDQFQALMESFCSSFEQKP